MAPSLRIPGLSQNKSAALEDKCGQTGTLSKEVATAHLIDRCGQQGDTAETSVTPTQNS